MLRRNDQEDREFWGFSLTRDGILSKDIKKLLSRTVNKVVEEAFEQNWELHWLPNIPCIFIKTSKEIWHFLPTKREAQDFKRNLVFSKHYPCCELY